MESSEASGLPVAGGLRSGRGFEGLVARARRRDPDGLVLRSAARATLVVPGVFAVGKLGFGEPVMGLFACFAAFSQLAFADFGGSARRRAAAYGGVTLAGCALVSLGYLTAGNPWAAGTATVVVVAAIMALGAAGGYFSAAVLPLALFWVLTATVPTAAGGVAIRAGGVALGGAGALVAGVLLWPHRERAELHRGAARVCRTMADVLAGRRSEAAVVADVADLRRRATAANFRPAGPTRRDVAFLWLLKDLDRLALFLDAHQGEDPAPARHEAEALRDAAATTLEGGADALDGLGDPPELDRLATGVSEYAGALVAWGGASIRSGEPPERVLDVLDASFRLRAAGRAVEVIATRAAVASGEDVDPEAPGSRTPGHGTPFGAVVHSVRVSRVDRQGAIRGGLALGLAVFLSVTWRLDHAFWVGLGTLSVLRSNAMGTGYTAAQALVGTVVGFGAAAAVMLGAGSNAVVLWVALPACIFLAVYTPTATHYVVGQAMFTLAVVVLLNLVAPEGWHIGIVRLEDVAIGVVVATAVGAVFWPRGARGQLRDRVAEAWSATAAYVGAAAVRALGFPGDEGMDSAATQFLTSWSEAGRAMATYMTERGHGPEDEAEWGALLSATQYAAFAGTRLRMLADHMPLPTGCPAARETLRAESAIRVASLYMVAAGLRGDSLAAKLVPLPAPTPDTGRGAVLRCLAESGAGGDVHDGFAVATVRAWLCHVDAVLADLPTDLMTTPDRPWWR